MSHTGVIDSVQALLPEWTVPVVVAVTTLGDVWFLFLLLPPLYWFGPARGWLADREDAGTLVGVVFCAFALVVGLKALFAVPRPPAAVHLVHADGYGFPSGHALGSTAVYGGMALLLDRWSRARRLLAATGLVAAISLSRVVLGVHHPTDVLAGVLVGLAPLGAVVAARRAGFERASPVVWLAALLGVGALAANLLAGTVTADVVQAFGAALGGALAWAWLDATGAVHRVSATTAAAGLVVFGALFAAVLTLEPPLVVTAVGNVVVFGGIVGLPGVEDLLAE